MEHNYLLVCWVVQPTPNAISVHTSARLFGLTPCQHLMSYSDSAETVALKLTLRTLLWRQETYNEWTGYRDSNLDSCFDFQNLTLSSDRTVSKRRTFCERIGLGLTLRPTSGCVNPPGASFSLPQGQENGNWKYTSWICWSPQRALIQYENGL